MLHRLRHRRHQSARLALGVQRDIDRLLHPKLRQTQLFPGPPLARPRRTDSAQPRPAREQRIRDADPGLPLHRAVPGRAAESQVRSHDIQPRQPVGPGQPASRLGRQHDLPCPLQLGAGAPSPLDQPRPLRFGACVQQPQRLQQKGASLFDRRFDQARQLALRQIEPRSGCDPLRLGDGERGVDPQ